MRRRILFRPIKVGYGNWSVSVSANLTALPNTGGTVAITAIASRNVYWSNGDVTTETATPSLTTSLGIIDGTTLTVGANTSTSNKTIIITATYAGVSSTCEIILAGKTVLKYGEWQITVSAKPTTGISAAGGTSTITGIAERTITWTDNSTTEETAIPTLTTNLGTIKDSTLTLDPNQTEVEKTATITATHKDKKATCTVKQNKDTVAEYKDVTITAGNIETIPAGGGSATSTGSNATLLLIWVSGRNSTIYPTVTEGTISNVPSKGTTISNKTLKGTVTITATGQGGKTATKTIAVYQAANLVTKVEAGSNSFSYSPIAAGATSAAATSSHSPKYTFSSGSSNTTTPDSKYGTLQTSVVYRIANTTTNGFTAVNSSTGTLTATSRGTTYGAESRTSATVTKILKYTWTHSSDYGGSSVNTGDLTKTATCSQNANLITKLELQNASGGALTAPGTYSAAEQTQSVANKTAASCGCKVTFSSTGSSTSYSTWVTLTTTYSWSSNKDYATLTSANASSLNVKMAGRGTTTGDARNATITRQAKFTATLKSGYTSASAVSTTASCTATVTQEKNAANASSAITSWGTPSGLIIGAPGINAGGGSAALSCTIPKNTRTYYYTSGSPGSTALEDATVAYKITKLTSSTSSSHGTTTISRFTISGTMLSHDTMGTNECFDVVTVRCYNTGSTGKYVELTTSVQNGITLYTSPVITFSYSNASPKNTTQTVSPTFTITVLRKYTSGSSNSNRVTLSTSYYTVTYSETTASSYASVNSSTGVITWNANGGVTTDRTVGITASVLYKGLAGTGTGSATATAKHTKDSISNPTYTWNTASVSYLLATSSSGTSTPIINIKVTKTGTWASGYTGSTVFTSASSKTFSLTSTGGTSGNYGSINSSTGYISWKANTSTSSRSMTVYVTLKVDGGNSSKSLQVSASQAGGGNTVYRMVTFKNNSQASMLVVEWTAGGVVQPSKMIPVSSGSTSAAYEFRATSSGSSTTALITRILNASTSVGLTYSPSSFTLSTSGGNTTITVTSPSGTGNY